MSPHAGLLTIVDCLLLQGCGTVTFATATAAAEAVEQLDGQAIWPSARAPLHVEFLNQDHCFLLVICNIHKLLRFLQLYQFLSAWGLLVKRRGGGFSSGQRGNMLAAM